MEVITTDVCIIGAGMSGLALAASLPRNINVKILSKSDYGMDASSYAQGGMSAIFDAPNSVKKYATDTFNGGCQNGDCDAINISAYHSSSALSWLESLGVEFNKDSNGEYSFVAEGGHSESRVVYSRDEIGKIIMSALYSYVKDNDNISMMSNYTAIDFTKSCSNVNSLYLLSNETNKIANIVAKFYVIATGGASSVYLNSTHISPTYGSGIAMAWRSGCEISAMEFTQFHPTSMIHKSGVPILISESLRGCGAFLVDDNGDRFMHKYSKMQELATRDIICRAMIKEISISNTKQLYLDISHKNEKWLKNRFPSLYRTCKRYGINIAKQKIPIAPAAHYSCGGIKVDNTGKSDCSNLYVVGESAYNGMHGANRLAGNSILECIVFARIAAKDICRKQHLFNIFDKTKLSELRPASDICNENLSDYSIAIKGIMWDKVGIIRNTDGLNEAFKQLNVIYEKVLSIYRNNLVSKEILELRDMIQSAIIITRSAILRKESRGVHYNEDYPYSINEYNRFTTCIVRSKIDEIELA